MPLSLTVESRLGRAPWIQKQHIGDRMKNGILLVIAAIAILSIVPTNVQATTEKNRYTLLSNQFNSYQINFSHSNSLSIQYSMEVIQDPDANYTEYVDVFFVDQQNYLNYISGQNFEYISSLTDINTTSTNLNATLTAHDTYYLVFDNTDTATAHLNSVTVNYTLTYNLEPHGDSIFNSPFIILAIIPIIAILMLVVVSILYNRIKKPSITQTNIQPQQYHQYQMPPQKHPQPQQSNYQQPPQPQPPQFPSQPPQR